MKKLWSRIKTLAKRIKTWAKEAWKKIKMACKKTGKMIVEAAEWATKHPETIYLACGALSLGTAGFKALRKTNVQKEQEFQRLHIYDYSLGHHWTLRRDLTKTEMLEYKRRKESGEPIGDILESMRVLA